MDSFEQQVRERAYHIWISAGMADGKADEHWILAERALLREQAPKAAAKTKAIARKKTLAKPNAAEATVKTSSKKLPVKDATSAPANKARVQPSIGEHVAH